MGNYFDSLEGGGRGNNQSDSPEERKGGNYYDSLEGTKRNNYQDYRVGKGDNQYAEEEDNH